MLNLRIPLHQLFSRLEVVGCRNKSTAASKIDRSKVPILDEKEIEENFISGHGPGGQCVNKAVNCCQLKHLPTGIVVKAHQDRSLEKNRKIAREILVNKLDNLYNGEQSIEAQKKRLALSHMAARDVERERRRLLKDEFKRNLQSSDSS